VTEPQRRVGSEFVCPLEPGDKWAWLAADAIVVANTDKPPVLWKRCLDGVWRKTPIDPSTREVL